ncbi:MAG: Re/Si-specific NAD(P)(+) transhydrogenase subunit alpha [Acidobacteria bacterium]|nr:Re/Si-specific NAD(P)(+) transhydrogenase subunit alpha [Acidobacteriota bacterium]MSO61835.1 Re/Si-specific NAD(P)(+) transhydrogenase subunit alpha [Acidobacteriota bacterium]
MKLAVPKECRPGERRVAVTPENVARLVKLGFSVAVEHDAGAAASFGDDDYAAAGAEIIAGTREIWQAGDIVLKVQPPAAHPAMGVHEAELIREGGMLISFLYPGKNKDIIDRLAARKATAIAVDQIPRISRAQKMDALSSMANIAGYRAVVEAASFYGRFFTGQMTAAGRVPPAKVLVIGAGVAGLAAIGAARGMGAIVRAFDTRPTVKEQVKSMGAEFIELNVHEDGEGTGGYGKEMSPAFIKAEMEMFAAQARDVDIIITTALIPNRPAPILITEEMVKGMKKGSVIVDLAAENGGNCALTDPGNVVQKYGVHILGYTDLPSRLAPTASFLFGNNLTHLLADLGGASHFHLDLADEVVRGALVLRDGELLWRPPARPPVALPPGPKVVAAPVAAQAAKAPKASGVAGPVFALIAAVALVGLGLVAPPAFLSHLTVFALSVVIGWQVVWNVTPALHTPLMSVTNAISGIIVLGGMLQLNGPLTSPVVLVGAAAILLATINIVGGFMVTQRMLRMFRR